MRGSPPVFLLPDGTLYYPPVSRPGAYDRGEWQVEFTPERRVVGEEVERVLASVKREDIVFFITQSLATHGLTWPADAPAL
jgi:hypothetical protein